MTAFRPARWAAATLTVVLGAGLLQASPAAAAGTGKITGTVTGPTGKALNKSAVDLYSFKEDQFTKVATVTTSSSGAYSFSGLEGGYYAVGFGAKETQYLPEFWNDRVTIYHATKIVVSTSTVAGVNASLSSGGVVDGRVTRESDGGPVADAEVAAYIDRDGSREYRYQSSVATRADGSFAFASLPQGRYVLEFNPPVDGPDADLALEYTGGAVSLSQADSFQVKSGTVVEPKFAELGAAGRVSGQVTDLAGRPIPGAVVLTHPGRNPDYPGNITIADEDGRYVLQGVAAGEQRIRFEGPLELQESLTSPEPEYATEFWDDWSTLDSSDPVDVVADATVSGKDARLALTSSTPVNRVAPSIIGAAEVGIPLRIDVGTWDSRIDTYDTRWLVDGVPVAGGSSYDFVPQAAHVGKRISAEVTVRRYGVENVARAMTAQTSAVTLAAPRNVVKPQVEGEARVGGEIRLKSGEWANTEVTLTHQLLADGAVVPGATDSHVVITPAMLGKKLALRETATRPGHPPATVVSDSTPVVQAGEIHARTPTVSGAPIVGEELTVDDPRWSSTGKDVNVPLTYGYQWFVGGSPVVGATAATYTPTATAVGQHVTVRVTATRPGYTTAVAVSQSVSAVAPRDTLTVVPGTPTTVSSEGEARIGASLTAWSGIWAPGGVEFSYAWFVDGAPLDGATQNHLTLTKAMAGKRVSVQVTGRRTGYLAASAMSEGVVVLDRTRWGPPQNLRSSGSSATTIDLTWTKVADATKYRIYYGIGNGKRTKVEVGDVSSTTLKGLSRDTEYSIDITALAPNGEGSGYSSRIPVRTTGIGVPSDLTVTQQTPTTVTVSWTKVPGVPKYRLYHGIGTGKRTKVEVGDVSTATIKGLKPGTTYSIDVASLLADGSRSAYTPRVDATTSSLEPPTNLRVVSTTSTSITLAWDKVTGIPKYRLYHGIGSGKRTKVEVGDVDTVTISKLKPSTTYTIDIASLLSDGTTRSGYSPRLPVTTD